MVPLFILRVPVRYYRQPPVYFREWRSNAPPGLWGEHGALNGSSVDADGTDGSAALLQLPPRCPFTSGSMQEPVSPPGGAAANAPQRALSLPAA